MSHTQTMEIEVAQNQVSTKEMKKEEEVVSISVKEAEEYRGYKKQQKIVELTGAISRSATKLGVKDNTDTSGHPPADNRTARSAAGHYHEYSW